MSGEWWAKVLRVVLALPVRMGRALQAKWRQALGQGDVFDWYFWITVSFIVVAILGIYFVPRWQEPKDLDLQNRLRQTVAQFFAGLFAVFGLLLAIRRAQQNAKSVSTAESEELTGRYFRGVELLGSLRDGVDGQKEASLEIRLGAIHAFRRLAGDSERDAATIAEILQAYVQLNAPRKSQDMGGPSEPRLDIQAVLDVLIRPGIHRPISLHRCDLTGSRMEGADLRSASLVETNLFNSALSGTDLRGADLRGVGLVSANLKGAQLAGADLSGA
ncbi:MAG: pentapeptide repeat-containing protein, partial [Planctomycetota bacterium]